MLNRIKEILENLFLMRTVYAEELDEKSKFYCRPFRLKKVNDKWIEEEYKPILMPYGVWFLLRKQEMATIPVIQVLLIF